jgi:NADH-quinone oxidoreductase subunit D
MSRSCGITRDLRLNKYETYANYYFVNFRGYTGQHGDCYDRFLIRMNEMLESVNIVNQSIGSLSLDNQNKVTSNSNINKLSKFLVNNEFLKNNNKNNYNSMENLISHFKE